MATWFVADAAGSSGAAGNDANAGTTGAPFRTLVKAWRSCANGDTIRIKTPGTWLDNDAKFHTQATAAGVVPVDGNVNIAPTDVLIEIDPATSSGDAEFSIAWGTGWKTNEQGGAPLRALWGHLWEFINPSRLRINGKRRLYLSDYDSAVSPYPSVGPEELFSSALYLIQKTGKAGLQTYHNSLIEGVYVRKFFGMGFMQNLVRGCHFLDCETLGDPSPYSDATGCVSGFRIEGADGSRVRTTLSQAVNRGATQITVGTLLDGSGQPMAVGHLVRIDQNAEFRELRKITAISGNTLTLGGYKHAQTDEFLSTQALEFPHAAGVEVETQFGWENCRAIDNGRMGRRTQGGGDDAGAEGLVIVKGAQRQAGYHFESAGNWSREGSFDYNIDGGAMTPFATASQGRIIVSQGVLHDNHSTFELGVTSTWQTDQRDCGDWTVDQMVVYGLSDYNFAGLNQSTAAGAGLSLNRAGPGTVFRRWTVWVDNGANFGGFIWALAGTTYSGTVNDIKVLDCILGFNYSTNAFRFSASVGAEVAVGTRINRNIVYKPVAIASNAAATEFGGVRTYAYTEAGRAAFFARTGLSQLDKWGVDPLWENPTAHDFRLKEASPARGMGLYGGDIGAIPFEAITAVPSAIASDDYNRTAVAAGWGTATTGGAWTHRNSTGVAITTDGTHGLWDITGTIKFGEALLLAVQARDVDSLVKWRLDKLPTTAAVQVFIGGRALGTPVVQAGGYFGAVTIQTSGALYGSFIQRGRASPYTQTLVGPAAATSGKTYVATEEWWTRVRLSGATPTTLEMRIWKDGTAEPGTWDFTTTDSTVEQQVSGAPGLKVYQGGIGNSPIQYRVDDYTVESLQRGGPVAVTSRGLVALTGKMIGHGTVSALAHARVVVTGTATTPAPVGRQTPPYLLPEAPAATAVGTWNRTDAAAVRDDPDQPDAAYVALTGGTSGKVSWRFPQPPGALDTTTNGQTFEVAMRNPAAGSYDFIVRLLELVAGVWTVKKTSATQSLAGGASVKYLFTWSRSDLTDILGDDVAVEVELV